MDAAELASRLLLKPVTVDRIAKLPRHLTSWAMYEEFLGLVPGAVAELIDIQIGRPVRVTFDVEVTQQPATLPAPSEVA
jgi:hypothetical protein